MDPARGLLRDARTIAVVAAAARLDRPWHDVARYLIDAGYTVHLVNPVLLHRGRTEALDRPLYARVQELPEPVDIVDLFRRSVDVPPVVEDAIAAGAGAVWMQLGIAHEAAAARARAAGLAVVMNRCTAIEHRALLAAGEGGSARPSTAIPPLLGGPRTVGRRTEPGGER